MGEIPLGDMTNRESLPIRYEVDFSSEQNLTLFIYKQKYNMKKNDCFSLEKRKADLEKEVEKKDRVIRDLKSRLQAQDKQGSK